jgi:soluble cytochrome b562
MKNITLPFLTASVLVTIFFATATPGHAQDDRKKTPLAEQMGGISHDIRTLRKMISDPAQKDAAVALVKDMEARATKAETFEPSKAKDIPPADHDQFIADYKKQMEGLIADFKKLEDAVSAGNAADAGALLDKLNSDKREGHKKFNADNH